MLTYNNQPLRLTVNDEHILDSFHRQQAAKTLHIKFPHVISNSNLCHQTNEIPLASAIMESR